MAKTTNKSLPTPHPTVRVPLSLSDLSWLEAVPSSPGVYVFEDKNARPLYIGKSIDIRSRIKQHLQSALSPHFKQSLFVPLASHLSFYVTTGDLEAIILESYLIKTISPKYNSLSKDDKTACYITITNFPDSKFTVSRTTDLDLTYYDNPATQIYGPFLSAKTAKDLLTSIRHIFGYCQHPFNASARGCFYYHLHQCPGACTGQISAKDYQQHLISIKRFLSGEFKSLIESYKKSIRLAMTKHDYETAIIKRDQLARLKQALSLPKLTGFLEFPVATKASLDELVRFLDLPNLPQAPHRLECYDIAHLQQDTVVGGMSVLEGDMLYPSQYRHFVLNNQKLGDAQSLKEIVTRRLKHSEWLMPNLIILDGGVGQLAAVYPIVPNTIAVVAISKKRETLHFYRNSKITSLNLPLHRSSLKLIQTLRDEAHRFTTTFHSKSRRQALLEN